MDNITLTPELERFAADAVARGRFRSVSEVVQASLELLRRAEVERAAFIASLEEAEAEGEREGFLTAEQVHREMTELIDQIARTRV